MTLSTRLACLQRWNASRRGDDKILIDATASGRLPSAFHLRSTDIVLLRHCLRSRRRVAILVATSAQAYAATGLPPARAEARSALLRRRPCPPQRLLTLLCSWAVSAVRTLRARNSLARVRLYMSPLAATQLALPSSLVGGPAALATAFSLPHSAVALPPPPGSHISNLTASLTKYWHAGAISGTGNLNWTAANPFEGGNGGRNPALEVHYPAGTRDGAQFPMNLFAVAATDTPPVQTAVLSYDVAFDPTFDWVKGGKLPGLYGASPNATSICTGGNHQPDCFSARLMWRNKGIGEGDLCGSHLCCEGTEGKASADPPVTSPRVVYAYIPSYDGFCQQSDVLCNQEYGTSLSRGAFSYARGGCVFSQSFHHRPAGQLPTTMTEERDLTKSDNAPCGASQSWTRITQLVSLNAPGKANGILVLYANDTLALAQTGIVYRTSEDVTLTTVLFSTFFGGSDASWDSTGGEAYFRNFAVSPAAFLAPLSLSCAPQTDLA